MVINERNGGKVLNVLLIYSRLIFEKKCNLGMLQFSNAAVSKFPAASD